MDEFANSSNSGALLKEKYSKKRKKMADGGDPGTLTDISQHPEFVPDHAFQPDQLGPGDPNLAGGLSPGESAFKGIKGMLDEGPMPKPGSPEYASGKATPTWDPMDLAPIPGVGAAGKVMAGGLERLLADESGQAVIGAARAMSPALASQAEKGAHIAQAYEAMSHAPNDPQVKKAYDSLINETLDQFQKIKDSGMKIEAIKPGQKNPYPNGSKDLFNDISENKHIYYYPTEQGFGSSEAATPNHPMLRPTKEVLNDKPLLANDVFRIVHDINGHMPVQSGFGPLGEEAAWQQHMKMYSPEAQKALTTETRGQNSWVNFGPYGEANRSNPAKTVYADQKAGLLPDWAMDANLKAPQPAAPGQRLVHYSQSDKPLTSVDPAFMGQGKQGAEFKRGDIVPRSYYYEEGSKPEDLVSAAARTVNYVNHPGNIMDLASPAAEPFLKGADDINELERNLKAAGFAGYKNSAHPNIPNAVALFEPQTVVASHANLPGAREAMDAAKVVPLKRNAMKAPQWEPTPDSLGMYSKAEELIQNKMGGSATPQQILSVLKDAKPEEVDYLGIPEFLEGKSKVSKQELLDHMKGSQLQVSEIAKKELDPEIANKLDDYRRLTNVRADDSRLAKGDYDREHLSLAQALRDKGHSSDEAFAISRKLGTHVGFDPDARSSTQEWLKNNYPELDPKRVMDTADAAATARNGYLEARQKLDALNIGLPEEPKFGQYSTPGGENYKETLFTLPQKASPQEQPPYQSSHWNEPNVLAHARTKEFQTTDKEPVLHVDEIQSDWHQAGRQKGYKGDTGVSPLSETEKGELTDLDQKRIRSMDSGKTLSPEEESRYQELANRWKDQIQDPNKVPEAPLKKTWHEFVFKNLLNKAAQDDKAGITWTTGDTQANRYDLSKQIDHITYKPIGGDKYKVIARDFEGNEVHSGVHAADDLEGVIGKDIAQKITEGHGMSVGSENSTTKRLNGRDLKMGGEGMKGFYDKILPDYANKLAKKYGIKVEKNAIETPNGTNAVHFLRLTPEMKADLLKRGMPRFAHGGRISMADGGDVPQGFIPDSAFQPDEETYGTTGQQILTGLEGAGEAMTFGTSPLIEQAGGIPAQDIRIRRQVNPGSHMLGQGIGLGISALVPGAGEAKALQGAGKAAAALGEKLGLGAVGQGITRGATENAIFSAGDEISKLTSGDPDQSLQTAMMDVGLSGLIGGAVGAVHPLWNATAGGKLSQAIADFKGRINEHLENPDPVHTVAEELGDFYTNTKGMADDVYGPNGLKAKDIAKAMPQEFSSTMADQAQEIASNLGKRIEDMGLKPEAYPPRLVMKLQDDLNGYLRAVTDPEVTPGDMFNAAQDLKQTMQGYAKYDKFVKPVDEAYDFVRAAKDMAYDLRQKLEDTSVWGNAAKRQVAINKAFTEFRPALEDFERKFTSDVGGQRVVDPSKISTYMNQLGKPSAELKQEMLENFLNAANKYRGVISDTHSNLGLDNPLQATSLSKTMRTLDKVTPGQKLADAVVKYGLSKVGGGALGAGVGGAAGHLVGMGGFGALLGEHTLGPVFESLLPTIMRPLLENGASGAAMKSAMEYTKAVTRGDSLMTRAVKNLFKAGKEVLPEGLMPSDKDRERLDKQLRDLQTNPDKLMGLSNHPVGDYMPDHLAAMSKTAQNAANYLNSLRPDETPKAPLDSKPVMNSMQKSQYHQALNIAQQPLTVVRLIQKGMVTPGDVVALKTMYPELYARLGQRMTDEVMEQLAKGQTVPYKLRMGLSMFTGTPLDSTLTPMGIMMAQPKPKAPQGGGPAAPVKRGTASLSKFSQGYETPGQAAEKDRQRNR